MRLVNLVFRYGLSVSQRIVYSNHSPVVSSFMTYHRVGSKSTTTGATRGTRTGTRPECIADDRVDRFSAICVVFCRSLFVP
jgi:hypothetical protein